MTKELEDFRTLLNILNLYTGCLKTKLTANELNNEQHTR